MFAKGSGSKQGPVKKEYKKNCEAYPKKRFPSLRDLPFRFNENENNNDGQSYPDNKRDG